MSGVESEKCVKIRGVNVLVWGVALACVAAAAGRPPDAAGTDNRAEQDGAIAQLTGTLRELGWWNHLREPGVWEGRRAARDAALRQVCARYGWDAPADRFWIDAVQEVRAVPPWDLQARFDTVMDVLTDRYQLSEDQRGVLSNLIVREGGQVIAQHGMPLLQLALEVRQNWFAGEPITPEQVAGWVEAAEPVFRDVRRRADAAAGEFARALDATQRTTLERDLALVNHRLDGLLEVGQTWAGGEWTPADWGLKSNVRPRPVEPTASQAPVGESNAAPAAPLATKRPTEAADEEPWARYVRGFITKYGLDAAQEQRAWIAYRDAKDQGDKVRRRYAAQAELVKGRGPVLAPPALIPLQESLTARQTAALEQVFDHLKTRLDRLPTRAQRRAAGGDDSSDRRSTTRPSNP